MRIWYFVGLRFLCAFFAIVHTGVADIQAGKASSELENISETTTENRRSGGTKSSEFAPAVEPTLQRVKSANHGLVYVVPIQGQVTKAQFLFLRRALKEAEAEGAAAVVLDMDTPGGELNAAVDMVEALQSTQTPTLTFVNRNAGSAGALIALATHRIYMTPVGAIGAAAPVMGGGQDLGEAMNDKVVSYFSKYFRSAAERSGHNPEIAEAFINKNIQVEIGSKVISEKGSLLTLSPQEAAEVINGKPVLASGIVESLDELLVKDGLKGVLKRVEPTGMEVVAFYITLLAPLLLIIGIAGAYLEFKSPGFGVPGIVAAICFVLFFTGHWVAGLAGQEALVFFVLGFFLVLAELIFFPGLIFPAVIGVGMMFLGLLWAMVDRYPSEPVVPEFSALTVPLRNLAISIVGGGVLIAALAQLLPRTSFFRRMSLANSLESGASLPAPLVTSEFASKDILPGTVGRTTTVLRPAGKALIAGRIVDVVAVGEFIQRNEPVRVVASSMSQVVVEHCDDEESVSDTLL